MSVGPARKGRIRRSGSTVAWGSRPSESSCACGTRNHCSAETRRRAGPCHITPGPSGPPNLRPGETACTVQICFHLFCYPCTRRLVTVHTLIQSGHEQVSARAVRLCGRTKQRTCYKGKDSRERRAARGGKELQKVRSGMGLEWGEGDEGRRMEKIERKQGYASRVHRTQCGGR